MPIISSDTLFHFTNKENLLGILKHEFHPRFSLEQYQFGDSETFKVGIPMVCFCDIPLSLVRKHMTKYGNYGIGMSKQWAESKKLNPVLYLNKDSETARILDNALNAISRDVTEVRNQGVEIHSLTEQRNMLFQLFTFSKPFAASVGNDTNKFYDEREWRYVPNISSYNGSQIMLTESQFQDPLLSAENEKLKNAKLSFQPNDINYIIIKEESERLYLINEIDAIKGKFSHDTRRILLSKIITAEQILQDF